MTDPTQAVQQIVATWRADPIKFVSDCYRVQPAKQQRQFLNEVRKLVQAKDKAYWSGRDGMTEEEIQYARKRGITIRSGHGCGKTTAIAWAITWFLLFFKDKLGCGSLIGITAPTSAQLKSVLWREIGKWVNRTDAEGNPIFPFKNNFQILSDRIQLVEANGSPWQGGPYAVGRTAAKSDNPEKQGETLAGLHQTYFMVVADEASGVPDPVFAPLEGAMTQDVNFIILISNPTQTKGFFYDSHSNPAVASQFIRIHWSAVDSELVSPDSVEMMRAKYGEQSNRFRIRVLGEFPLVDNDVLIPFEWAQRASESEIQPSPDDPIIIGVDVARFGSDSTAICVRHGPRVIKIVEAQKIDTVEVAEFVLQVNQEYEPSWICIDTCGIGGAVYDFLRTHLPNKVKSVNVAEKASNQDKYDRKREELFWRLRERFESGRIALPSDSDLIHEVSTLRCEWRLNKLKVETKQDLKKRGIESPNRLDALMLTMSVNDQYYAQTEKPSRYGRDKSNRMKSRVRSWMGL